MDCIDCIAICCDSIGTYCCWLGFTIYTTLKWPLPLQNLHLPWNWFWVFCPTWPLETRFWAISISLALQIARCRSIGPVIMTNLATHECKPQINWVLTQSWSNEASLPKRTSNWVEYALTISAYPCRISHKAALAWSTLVELPNIFSSKIANSWKSSGRTP